MRISFDLDDTLVCYRADVPQEPRLPWFRRLFADDEPLRQGVPELMRQLRQRGIQDSYDLLTAAQPSHPQHNQRLYEWRFDIAAREVHRSPGNPQGAQAAAERMERWSRSR